MDFTRIAEAALGRSQSLLREWFPAGKLVGAEFHVGSLAGEAGESLSVNVNSGRWADFASDAKGGDLVSLYAAKEGIKNGEAAKRLAVMLGVTEPSGPVDPYAPVNGLGRPSAVHEYRTAKGALVGYQRRFDLAGGKKEFRPLTVDKDGNWSAKAFPEPRPLYGVELLAKKPGAPVLIVEGEKTADAARKLFPEWVVLSWYGGSKAVGKADWGPLVGKSVVIWPDNDEPGLDAARMVAVKLTTAAVVPLPHGLPAGWDLADPIPAGVDPLRLITEAREELTQRREESLRAPYRLLGVNSGNFYYFCENSQDVVFLKASEHTEANLQQLAGHEHWMEAYPSKSGADYKMAMRELIAAQFKTGLYYDETQRRGRGCWLDDGRIVFHCGSHLIVDGRRVELSSFRTEYVYLRQPQVRINLTELASVAEGAELFSLISSFRFTSVNAAWQFAGWLVCAAVPGVLSWRPHGQLTGTRGAGKTTMQGFATAILGPLIERFTGGTTKAGIASALRCDALSVSLDEAEGDTPVALNRNSDLMELARIASSENGAKVAKGTPGGLAVNTTIMRSCFLLAAIGEAPTQEADKDRFCIWELVKGDGATWPELKARLASFELGKFPAKFQARCVAKAREIRASVGMFTDAICGHLGDARVAQQQGALMGGYWMLLNDAPPTVEQATQTVQAVEWDVSVTSRSEAEHENCWTLLLQSRILIEDGEMRIPSTVGGAVEMVRSNGETPERRDAAFDSLLRMGIRATFETVDVAVSHPELAKVFSGTSFFANGKWAAFFRRMPDSRPSTFRIPGGRVVKAIRIPLKGVE